jgi:4-amino-4-deoxy-L-arabinose transferase-like glycosyltransferase
LKSKPELLLAVTSILAAASSAALLLLKDQYSLLYYGDAVSNLVISRRIVDSIEPGFAQVGSVWLPVTHLSLLPFVSIDYLFRTGLAGTIVSAAAMAVTVVGLFKIIKFQFNSTKAGLLGGALYLLNPSILYMGIVAMTEAPFIMFFVLAAYFLQQWYHSPSVWKQYRSMMKCALAISGATLTRYEGWVLPLALLFVVLIVFAVIQRETWGAKRQAFLTVAVSYSSFGVLLWLLWNLTIFRDPLYFANAPYYSAQQQALSRPFSQHLYLQPLNSFTVMVQAAQSMYGAPILIISVISLSLLIWSVWTKKLPSFSLLLVTMLLAPLLANYLALVGGFGEIYPLQHGFFNGRFLTFAAPFLAFASTFLVVFVAQRKSRMMTILVVALVVGSYGVNFEGQFFDPSTTVAMSGAVLPFQEQFQVALATGREIGTLFSQGAIVLFTPSNEGQQMMITSGLPLKDFIDVNAGHYWNVSERSPWVYGSYLVIAKTAGPEDAQLLAYWQSNAALLTQHFTMVYENQYYEILANQNTPASVPA